MSVDFFDNKCENTSNKIKFGLCDDPPPAENPAYIDENDVLKWIGIVENNTLKKIKFIAIDACIDIRKPDGALESRCDGMLVVENNIIFVELKSREGGQWVKKGREQLTNTIGIFRNNYDTTIYQLASGSICNSLRPQSHAGHAENIQKFYDETGLMLNTERVIKI